MLTIITLVLGLAAGQEPAPATIVTATEQETVLKKAIADKTIDTLIKETPIPGAKTRVAMLHRDKAETSALIHNDVTEVYQIIEGSGTITTGGSLSDAKPSDLTRLGAGMSQTGVHTGGESRHVGPKDIIIVPAGTPHRFSQLDAPISYVVYRFEPNVK
jgi:mannose-6-phosphate isomerase-like protein (cupin superfamily)